VPISIVEVDGVYRFKASLKPGAAAVFWLAEQKKRPVARKARRHRSR
jgi:hypothetical protein